MNNLAFFASNYNILAALDNHAGIVTPLVLQRCPVYQRGEVVKEARFIGQTFTAGTEVEPVVVVFDMRVDDVITDPTKVTLKFTVLSEPCTYLWGPAVHRSA